MLPLAIKPGVIVIICVIVIIIVVSVVRISRRSSASHFECPNCGEHFQSSFSKSFFTAHNFNGSYNMTCPKCGQSAMMIPKEGRG